MDIHTHTYSNHFHSNGKISWNWLFFIFLPLSLSHTLLSSASIMKRFIFFLSMIYRENLEVKWKCICRVWEMCIIYFLARFEMTRRKRKISKNKTTEEEPKQNRKMSREIHISTHDLCITILYTTYIYLALLTIHIVFIRTAFDWLVFNEWAAGWVTLEEWVTTRFSERIYKRMHECVYIRPYQDFQSCEKFERPKGFRTQKNDAVSVVVEFNP